MAKRFQIPQQISWDKGQMLSKCGFGNEIIRLIKEFLKEYLEITILNGFFLLDFLSFIFCKKLEES